MFIQRLAGALIIGGLFTASANAQSYIRQVEPTPDQLSDSVRGQFIRAGDVSPEEYARLLEEAEKVRAYQGGSYSYEYTQPAATTYSTGTTIIYDGQPTYSDTTYANTTYSGTTSEGYQIELYDTPITQTATITSAPTTYSSNYSTLGSSHTVVKGDNLYRISQRYGVSLEDLRSANGIYGNTINIGQVLVMPGQRRSISQPITSGSSATLVRNVEPIPFTGIYAVLPGDTLWSIAQRACVSVDEVKAENAMGGNTTIMPGQRLSMPSGHCLN